MRINRQITEEVDITLPLFFKTSAHIVGIIDEKTCIVISECLGMREIKFGNRSKSILSSFGSMECKEITAERFSCEYEKVSNELVAFYNNKFLKK